LKARIIRERRGKSCSPCSELLSEKQTLEGRIVKIDTILSNNAPLLEEDCFESASFQMITEILGADQIERYSNTWPEIYNQHSRLSGILDDFQWCDDFREGFRILAVYFLKTTSNNMNWHWRQVSVGRKSPTLMKMIPNDYWLV
jgi:hypothetical protein